MSIDWICNFNYYDGVHKVKHKLTDEESFVYVGEALIHDDEFYMVLDCKTDKVVNNDNYDHLAYYEDGRHFECSQHKGEWMFDDGYEHCDECPKCKSLEDEISSFKVAEDVYQYNNNSEFNDLKYLLKADKYRFWSDDKGGNNVKPEQGLLILITEYDSDGDEYYYYKTVEKSFMNGLEWSVK